MPTRYIRFHNEPMTQIWERLFLGCYGDAEQVLQGKNPHDIDAIVNCTPDRHKDTSAKILVRECGFEDGEFIPEATFWKAIDSIRTLLWHNRTVLVHCHAGMSRSVAITAAYLYLCGFDTFYKCLDYIQQKRDIADPNGNIILSVKKHLRIYPYDGTYQE